MEVYQEQMEVYQEQMEVYQEMMEVNQAMIEVSQDMMEVNQDVMELIQEMDEIEIAETAAQTISVNRDGQKMMKMTQNFKQFVHIFYHLKQITQTFDLFQTITSMFLYDIIMKSLNRCCCSYDKCQINWNALQLKDNTLSIIHCPSFKENGIKCHLIDSKPNFTKCKNCDRLVCLNCAKYPLNGYESDFTYLNEDYDDSPICYGCINHLY